MWDIFCLREEILIWNQGLLSQASSDGAVREESQCFREEVNISLAD